MISFVGFAPDLPPETPGIFTDCNNILPCITGFESAKSPVDSGLGAINSACVGFAVVRKTDGNARTFCGTSTKLYENTGTWADESKAGGYSLGSDDRWRFAQFGNTTLAAAKTETIQANSSTIFANLSGTAPKAAIIETINNQVFAFDTNDAGFGDDPTRWWCSALGSSTDWTPSVTTQCVSGQLLSAPGGIKAGKKLGEIIVAYKSNAIYVGQYVGAPVVWDFRQLPGNIGAPSQEAVVTTGTAHYFIGQDDFYVFDGTRPVPLNPPIRDWFFDNFDAKFANKICGTYDQASRRIFWWFPTLSSSGALAKCIVLNTKTMQWGRMDIPIEMASDFVTSGVTYDGVGSLYATYDDLPTTISYDSPFWNSSGSTLSVFKSDHKSYTLSGTPEASSITTGVHGDNQIFSTTTRVKPRFLSEPPTSQMLYSYSNADVSSFQQNITSQYMNGWYDMRWSARWHRFELQFSGTMKITGYDATIIPGGTK